MPGQNNLYGSQDDPFGYESQQKYWQAQRAADAAKPVTPATRPLPVKQTVPTQPQVQPRLTPQGQQPAYTPPAPAAGWLPNGKWYQPNEPGMSYVQGGIMPGQPGYQAPYQSPYGRGYVPPNGGTQQIPTPQLINGDGGSMEPWLDAGMTYEQWMNRFRTAPAPNPQIPPWAVQPPSNIGTWNPPTQPALGIWNGPLPSKQPLPDDIYGFSKIYGKPIPEGQKWADVRPDRAYPAVQPQQSWADVRVDVGPDGGYLMAQPQQSWAIPQWYTARLQQQR